MRRNLVIIGGILIIIGLFIIPLIGFDDSIGDSHRSLNIIGFSGITMVLGGLFLLIVGLYFNNGEEAKEIQNNQVDEPIVSSVLLKHAISAPMIFSNIRYCGACKKTIPSDANICPFCGKNAISGICPNCGEENPSDHRFCKSCGCELKSKPEFNPNYKGKKSYKKVVSFVVAMFVIISAIGFVFIPGINVTESATLPINGATVAMNLHNDNMFFEKSGLLWVEIHLTDGSSYKKSKPILMAPGETMKQVTITINVPMQKMLNGYSTNIWMEYD